MRAFSLIELIFVIVIMGILTFIGLEAIPDETLLMDAKVLKQKILDKKSNALGFSYVGDNNLTCITLSKEALNLDENFSKVKYKFKSLVTTNVDFNKICFDKFGRVFKNEVDENLSNLLHKNIIISLKYRNEEINLTLYHLTGAIR